MRKDKRMRAENPDYVPTDYVPSSHDIMEVKKEMERHVQVYKKERHENMDMNLSPAEDKTEMQVGVIKEQVLDLHTKFDYMLSIMMRSNVL